MKTIAASLSAILLFAANSVFAQPGTLDSTFGINGIVTTDFKNSFETASSVVIQADGKIVVAGSATIGNGCKSDFALVRYKKTGLLDHSFGKGGKTTTDIQNSNDESYAIAIQPNGKIIIAGSTGIEEGDEPCSDFLNDFALVRYNKDGTPDTTFGNSGKQITDIASSSDDIAHAIAIQDDGKIIVAGSTFNNQRTQFALVRYYKNGDLDKYFGNNGKVITKIGDMNDQAQSVAVRPDGKIVVAGFSFNGSNFDIATVRYNADGTLDNNFGTSGIVTTDFGNGDDAGYSVAIQSNGKIVVAGYAYNGSNYNFALVRYKANGEPDNNFGTGGKVSTDVGPGHDEAYSVAIQQDGKILAGGVSYKKPFFSNADMAIVRYKNSGSLDKTFGTGGKVIAGGNREEYVQSIAIQPVDGKVVVIGTTNLNPGYDFILARYNTDDIILPVNIINLTAYQTGSRIKIDWTALNELNTAQYDVERSADGKDFITFGHVKALDNGLIKIDYSFTDIKPLIGDNFYRLKVVDKDGTKKYTNIVQINIESNRSGLAISPNPVKDNLHIEGLLSSSAKTISIIDITGRAMQKTVTSNTVYSFNVKQLQAGIYFIKIEESKKITTLKFIKE